MKCTTPDTSKRRVCTDSRMLSIVHTSDINFNGSRYHVSSRYHKKLEPALFSGKSKIKCENGHPVAQNTRKQFETQIVSHITLRI